MWGLIDCDNFFCSCERVWRPDLNGKPVVVLSNNDGCVVARSREAKAIGIRMGLPYYQMLEQYSPDAVTAFSSNYTLYGDMSDRVMATVREEVPLMHQYSIDEAFFDLTGFEAKDYKEWGERLAQKVYKWTGIPVSMGIAPTKTLAKMAAKYAKKYPGYHKCCVIATEEQRIKALSMYDVGDVWGIGRRIAARLAPYGVYTAYDYTMKSRQWVKSRFHVPGERTWLELRAINAVPVDEMNGKKKQSIMTSRSFPQMLTSLEDLEMHVANYASRCALKLRRQKTVCKTIYVFIHSNPFRPDLPQYSPGISFELPTPSNSSITITETALRLLHTIFKPGIRYKRGGVMVSDISPEEGVIPSLFDPDIQKIVKYNAVSRAVDRINSKLGVDTLILASQLYTTFDHQTGKPVDFTHAIRRALLSPDYSTSIEAFIVNC